MTNCGCIQNEEGLTVVFCRACAMGLEQGGEAWFRARLGCLSGSRISDALAKNRQGTGPGITQMNYLAELICERLNSVPYEGYQNGYMDRGKEEEEGAVNAYELMMGLETQKVGFVRHATIARCGASPDRVIGKVGLLEIKNRKTNIHFELLKSLAVPTGDINQVLFELACSEWAEWADYLSFDSRAPAGLDLFVKRFYREDHEDRIKELEQQGIAFLAEVEKQAKELQERALNGFIFLARENGNELATQLTESLAMKRKRKSND